MKSKIYPGYMSTERINLIFGFSVAIFFFPPFGNVKNYPCPQKKKHDFKKWIPYNFILYMSQGFVYVLNPICPGKSEKF